jgi:hypothetical protein
MSGSGLLKAKSHIALSISFDVFKQSNEGFRFDAAKPSSASYFTRKSML